MSLDDAVVVFVTVATAEEGAKIGRSLVEDRLAACVNLLPQVRSIYRWQGTLHDGSEALLLIKTRRTRFAALAARVRELHSYDVPEIIALPVTDGSEPYLNWVLEETS